MSALNSDVPRRHARSLTVIVALLVAQGCASGGTSGGSGSGNTITREQFSANDENAYLIIRRLRPSWLRPRTAETPGNSEPSFAQVFLDEMRLGDVDSLAGISATQIERIEYMSALDATTRYGTGYVGGLIIIRTIRR